MISIEQIKELQQRVETLGRCINVEDKRADVARRQERTLSADFWDDPKEAEKFLKDLSGVKFWVTGYDKVAAAVEDLNVLYDFATDDSIAGGDAGVPSQHGFWYFGFYGEASEVSAHIDPVPYTPKRTMSFTAGGTQIEGKILMYQTAERLGANKDIVIKGYAKVENYVAKNDTDHNVQIAPGTSGAASATANCDWTAFSTTWNTGAIGDYHVLKFGFWYAQGTMTLADIVIEDTEGNVLYDFASDATLPAGDITGAAQHGFWYFGFYGDQSEFSGHIDPAYKGEYKPTRVLSATGVNIESMTNKSKKDMAVTVIDMAELPSEQAIANIKRLPGIFRVRTFQ